MPTKLFYFISINLLIYYVHGIGYNRGYRTQVQNSGYNSAPTINEYYNVPSLPNNSDNLGYDFIQNNVATTTQKTLFQVRIYKIKFAIFLNALIKFFFLLIRLMKKQKCF